MQSFLVTCPHSDRYESVIATLCENLDSLDEPEARAAMIWIVGEYAERIDNADELLESFLEGFHDESTQVQGVGSVDVGPVVVLVAQSSHHCESLELSSWMQSILYGVPPKALPFLKAGRGQLLTSAGSALRSWKSPGLSPSCSRLPFSWEWWYHPWKFPSCAESHPSTVCRERSCSPSVCLSLISLWCMQVQLQLLTAIVKLFLKKPTETQELVQQVLSLATQVGASSVPSKAFHQPC